MSDELKLHAIDPMVQLEYWNTLGFRVPKFLEKFDQALADN